MGARLWRHGLQSSGFQSSWDFGLRYDLVAMWDGQLEGRTSVFKRVRSNVSKAKFALDLARGQGSECCEVVRLGSLLHQFSQCGVSLHPTHFTAFNLEAWLGCLKTI